MTPVFVPRATASAVSVPCPTCDAAPDVACRPGVPLPGASPSRPTPTGGGAGAAGPCSSRERLHALRRERPAGVIVAYDQRGVRAFAWREEEETPATVARVREWIDGLVARVTA